MSRQLTTSEIFGDTILAWGKKYPSEKMADIWAKDKSYLLWACGLTSGGSKTPDVPPPSYQRKLVELALELERGNNSQTATRLQSLRNWQKLAQEGEGLDNLPRPTAQQAQETISRATVIGGHSDLDGLFSLAIAIHHGQALGGPAKASTANIRILNYVYRNLNDFTNALALQANDRAIIIDFAAHPRATMTFDHHSTCLTYWEEGTQIPAGVFDTSMPSCPRLLHTHVGYKIAEEILQGCDRVDGAQYKTPEETSDLTNPFVTFEYLLGVDTTDNVKRSVVIELANTELDLPRLLKKPVWQARQYLLVHELDEQRNYWLDSKRVSRLTDTLAVVDGREAPHHPAKFRYLPFENAEVRKRNYLITIRPGRSATTVNLGLSRNPFQMKESSAQAPRLQNLGAIAKSIGQGGGRPEAASTTLPLAQLESALSQISTQLGE